ncbi:hypothetical protein EDD18DRAFT_1337187 [Armillaria luteobubalina]|uniref:Uncharacterized protein n=1 Tax=Armillaria luteobubalina TaxID=153913 RepID=A0AA39PAH4_9AGAR|nr:hypothetical protein EDD18DRAFT_1337187 [Armillaria luteobubalina]
MLGCHTNDNVVAPPSFPGSSVPPGIGTNVKVTARSASSWRDFALRRRISFRGVGVWYRGSGGYGPVMRWRDPEYLRFAKACLAVCYSYRSLYRTQSAPYLGHQFCHETTYRLPASEGRWSSSPSILCADYTLACGKYTRPSRSNEFCWETTYRFPGSRGMMLSKGKLYAQPSNQVLRRDDVSSSGERGWRVGRVAYLNGFGAVVFCCRQRIKFRRQGHASDASAQDRATIRRSLKTQLFPRAQGRARIRSSAVNDLLGVLVNLIPLFNVTKADMRGQKILLSRGRRRHRNQPPDAFVQPRGTRRG